MPRRTGSRSTRGRSSAPAGLFELFLRPQRSPLVRVLGLLVRLRAEITVIALLITVWLLLARHMPRWGATTTVTVVTVSLFVVPVSRRYLTRRMWCVLSRHRMRKALVNSRHPTMTYDGTLPYIVWSRPTPIGERLRVWLPAGLSVKDLDRCTDTIAVACWARDARLVPVRSQAALVIIDIVRRDPLAGDTTVESSVTTDLTGRADEPGELVPLPRRTLTVVSDNGTVTSTDDEHEPVPPRAPARNGRKQAATTTDAPSARGVGGMDVSDYV